MIVTFLSDAIGAENVPAYEASIMINFPLIANAVLTTNEFLAAVDGAAPGEPVLAQAGDTVRGSDHMEIGTVKEVVAATDDHEAYVLVPRGLIFPKDTFIPLDVLAKRSGTDVFLNLPKLVVGSMPWGEPPTRADRQAKRGPRAEDVGRLYRSQSPSAFTESGR
jgi:hypothetical protein